MYYYSPRVNERNAEDANLHVDSDIYQSVRTPVGFKVSRVFKGKRRGIVWVPESRLFYVREFADDSVRLQTSFANVPGIKFNAESGKWGRNSGLLGVGLSGQVSDRVTFRFDYDYEIYNYTTANIASATLNVKW